MSFVRWLDGYDPAERARLGGKNAGLGELLAAGLPVPPGFAVTVDAYHTVRGHPEVHQAVVGLLGEVDLADPAALEELSAAIRRRIEQVPLDDAVAGAVASAYTELCERARKDAFELMVQHAQALGANAIIGVLYDANEIMAGVTEVLCYGTAVVVEPVA